MSVQALGYVGVRAKTLDDWASFGSNFLGLQRVDKSRSTLAFRMDDRKQRLVVDADGGEGIGFFGWEVADAAALAALAAKLEQAGTKVAHGSRALADERHVKDLIVLSDPAGNRIELFHGAETASEPFVPGRNISGFRTGPLGMGHVVLHVDQIDRVLPFYQDLLGFRLSDFWLRPFRGYFMNVNQRHHSLAFIETGQNAPHHIMMELFSFDDVGQGYDIAQEEEGRVAVTLGRHTSDFITSFYSWNAVRLHDRVRLGRALHRSARPGKPFERKEGAEHLGPRSRLAVAGEAGRGARAAQAGGRSRTAPAGAGDGRQLPADARRLPVAGCVKKEQKIGERGRAPRCHSLRPFLMTSAERTSSSMLMRSSAAENATLGLRQCRDHHLSQQARSRLRRGRPGPRRFRRRAGSRRR